MAKAASTVDAAGLYGARSISTERLSSVANVKIESRSGFVISRAAEGGRFVMTESKGGKTGAKAKAVHKK